MTVDTDSYPPDVGQLEHVIARNVTALRQAQDWTQRDLALAMVRAGTPWTANRIAQVETLRRSLSLMEIASLCAVFEVDLDHLLSGSDDEMIEPGGPRRPVPLRDLRAALRGEGGAPADAHQDWRAQLEQENAAIAREELRRLGSKIDLTGDQLNALAIKIYGRGFLDERNRRAGDLTGASKRSAQTSRGHASRALLAELDRANCIRPVSQIDDTNQAPLLTAPS